MVFTDLSKTAKFISIKNVYDGRGPQPLKLNQLKYSPFNVAMLVQGGSGDPSVIHRLELTCTGSQVITCLDTTRPLHFPR